MDLAFNVEKLLEKTKKNHSSKKTMDHSLFFEKQMSEMKKLIEKQGKKEIPGEKQTASFDKKSNQKEVLLKEKVDGLEKKMDEIKTKLTVMKEETQVTETKHSKEERKRDVGEKESLKNSAEISEGNKTAQPFKHQKQNDLKIENQEQKFEKSRLKNMVQKENDSKIESQSLQDKMIGLKEEIKDIKETLTQLKEMSRQESDGRKPLEVFQNTKTKVENLKEVKGISEKIEQTNTSFIEEKSVVGLHADEKILKAERGEINEEKVEDVPVISSFVSSSLIKQVENELKQVENELKQVENELKQVEKEGNLFSNYLIDEKETKLSVSPLVRQEVESVFGMGKNPIVKEKETIWSERVVLSNENESFTKGIMGKKDGMTLIENVSADEKDESEEMIDSKQSVSAVFGEILTMIKQDRTTENEILQENKTAIVNVTVSLGEERNKRDELKQKQENEIQQLKMVSSLLDALKPDAENNRKQEKINEPVVLDGVKKVEKGKVKETEEVEKKSVKAVEEVKENAKVDYVLAPKEHASEKIDVKTGKAQENNNFKELFTMAEKKDVELKVVQQDKIVFSIPNGKLDGEVEVEVIRENENLVVRFQVEEVKAKVKLEEMMLEMKEEFKKKGIEMEINIEVKQGKDEEKQREHKKEKEEYPSMAKPSNGDNDNQEESFLEKINQWIGG